MHYDLKKIVASKRCLDGLIFNYVGVPSAGLNSFPEINSSAEALIASARAHGYTVEYLDLSTTGFFRRISPPSLRSKLQQAYTDRSPRSLDIAVRDALKIQIAEEERVAQRIIDELRDTRPLFIGATVWMGDGLEGTMRILTIVHEQFPDLPIVCGGPQVTASGRSFMEKFPLVDHALVGDADSSLPALIGYFNASVPHEDVPGLLSRTDDGRIVSTVPERGARIDRSPVPEYFSGAYRPDGPSESLKVMVIDNARGCGRSCIYCSIPHLQGKHRERSPEQIVYQMLQGQEYGVHYSRFAAPNTSYAQISAVADILHTLAVRSLSWTVFANIDGASSAVLEKSHAAGLEALFLGIESASDTFHDHFTHHKVRSSEVRASVHMMKEIGLFVTGSFIIGYPGESEDDWKRTRDLIVASGFDSVLINPLVPFPETVLYKKNMPGIEILVDDAAYKDAVMSFKVNLIDPLRMMDLPFRSNAMSFRELLELTDVRTKELQCAGVTVGIDGDLGVLAKKIGMKPQEFVSVYQRLHYIRDVDAIEQLIRSINDALATGR